MKTKIVLIVLLNALLFSGVAQKNEQANSKTILFIGNSLTYYNDMPQILQQMFKSQKLNYDVRQCTYSGISLTQHLNRKIKQTTSNNAELSALGISDTSETVKLLQLKKWNFVVLQDGTVRLLIPEVKNYMVIPAVQTFKEKLKGTQTELILFETWPSLDTFPKQYCYPKRIIDHAVEKDMCCSPIMHSIEEEAQLIKSAYDTVALATNIPTVPTTNCFMEIIKQYPNINLAHDINSHPSKLGAYLNACLFYKCFTKQKATTIKYRAGIDKKTVKIIQDVVDKYYP
jgi:hypothetical protein